GRPRSRLASGADTNPADATGPPTLPAPQPHTEPARHATTAETLPPSPQPASHSTRQRSPPTQPDTSALPRSTPSWNRASRINRNHCQASAGTVSGINRNQNVNQQPNSYIKRGRAGGARTRDPRIM